MTFGEKLKAKREERGFTQEDLAFLINENLTRQMVSKWETTPGAYPQVETLLSLSVILDISLDELFADELNFLKKGEQNKEFTADKYPGLYSAMQTLRDALKKINI